MHELHNEIRQQVEAGFNYNEIMSNLLSSGYSAGEISKAIEEVNEGAEKDYQTRSPILSSVYLPFALAFLTFILFFFVIPDDTFSRYSTFFTVIGAVGFAALLAWGLFRFAFRNVKKYPWLDNSPIGIIFACVIFMFIFGGFLISRGVNAEHDELVQYGKLVEATVMDGRAFRGRRSSMASIKVKFGTKSGAYTAKLDISEREFDKYYEGQKIIILYSTQNPDIATEINHKSAIDYYKLEDKILQFREELNKP